MNKIAPEFDYLGPKSLGTFGGMKIVESSYRPKYSLPAEVMPGVPWPVGFREDFNRWSQSYLGEWNPVPKGTVYMTAEVILMRPEDIAR